MSCFVAPLMAALWEKPPLEEEEQECLRSREAAGAFLAKAEGAFLWDLAREAIPGAAVYQAHPAEEESLPAREVVAFLRDLAEEEVVAAALARSMLQLGMMPHLAAPEAEES